MTDTLAKQRTVRCPRCGRDYVKKSGGWCRDCTVEGNRLRRTGGRPARARPTCGQCGIDITDLHPTSKFCGLPCRREAYREKRRDVTRRAGVKYRYGMTLDEVTQAIGPPARCAICGTADKLQIDHCHSTGRLRGWLCGTHNRALGLLGDDPVLLAAAAAYLESALAASSEVHVDLPGPAQLLIPHGL